MNDTLTPKRNLRRAARAGIALLLATAVAGCLKVDMDLSVEGETVNGTIVVGIDQTTAQLFGMEPEDLFEEQDDADFSTLDGVSTEPYESDGWIGMQYVFDRVDLDELNSLAQGDDEFPRIVYDEQAGTYEFTLTMDLSDWSMDELEEDESFPGFNPSALVDQFDVRVAVTFPGEVTDHNGELAGSTVTWSPEIGERNEMRAVATASRSNGVAAGLPGSGSGGSSSTSTALIVALVVLVLGVGGGLGLWLALRKRPSAAVAAAGAPAPEQPAPEQPAAGQGQG